MKRKSIISFLLLTLTIIYLVVCQNTKEGWDIYHDNQKISISDIPACFTISRLKGTTSFPLFNENINHIIVIGDIHGNFNGLLENLNHANITKASVCDWLEETKNTLFIQVGDVVDRGRQSSDSYFCLKHLQQTATNGNKVVRLLGNHDIWWLEGSLHMKHKDESIDKANLVIKDMKESIISNTLFAAYPLYYNGIPLLFSHAGLRDDMLKYINITDINLISDYINNKLLKTINNCKNSKCLFKDEIFLAGRDRGDVYIGGCTWTDFNVHIKENRIPTFHQIVGHSIHERVRTTRYLGVTDVDLGMSSSNKRGYLKIDETGRFLAVEKVDETRWQVRDLSKNVCE